MRILLGLDHLVGGHIDLDSMFFPIYEGPVATSWRHTSCHDGPAGERSWRPSMRVSMGGSSINVAGSSSVLTWRGDAGAQTSGRFFDARGSIAGKPITREGMHGDVGSG